jgi:DNA-binding CsgD family transcriptional regulator
MNNLRGQEGQLLDMIERIYAAVNDAEMVREAFKALRDWMPFPSGVFMPVDPDTLQLQAGLCFDCNAADMDTYLAHYAPLDPYVLRQPSPVLLNQTVRLSDVMSASELGRSEFGEFMQRVPYHHALGILTAVAGQPVAVFCVHRQRHERDFSEGESAIIDCIGPHLARAITLRRQASDLAHRREMGILVIGVGGEASYLNAAAQRFLGTTPVSMVRAALPPQGTGVISVASRRYRVSQVPWEAASLLHRFAVEDAVANTIDRRPPEACTVERWPAVVRDGAKAIIVTLRPFRQRMDLVQRLAQDGLSPRQSEIVECVFRGLSNGEIALQLAIGEQTVKDHLGNIFRLLGVRSRTALMARVMGMRHDRPAGKEPHGK